jgi:tetratricopeptide (TPR) repeat protein
VPELVSGLDVRSLPLSALEGFVFSRIDGRASVAEIVTVTGLPMEQVGEIIDKLVKLGAVRLKAPEPEPSARPAGRPSQRPGSSPSHVPHSRRRMHSMPPKRPMMAEGAISQPPPDTRYSQRAHSLPPKSGSRPPTAGQRAASQRPPPSPPRRDMRAESEPPPSARSPVPAPHAAIPPGPPSQPDLIAGMLHANLPYDPAELTEDVDLPLARRKQVLDLYYRLEHLDYYEALDIPYDADKKEVRRAYFALSKVFHPDTLFRKNLGSFKAKMEAVFKHLTEAYETLGKKKLREEYDRYLEATKKTEMAERTLAYEASRVRTAELEPEAPDLTISQAAPTQPEPEPVPVAPARPVSDEARRLAQQIMQRRLRGVGGRPAGEPPRVQSMAPPAPVATPAATGSAPPQVRTDPRELLRRLTRTLKDVGQVTGTNDQVVRQMKAAQTAFAKGDLAEATRLMQRVVSAAPEREDLRVEYDRMSQLLSQKLASDYEERARFEQKGGKWASAALSWAKVCEGRPDDALAHKSAAAALLKAGGDLRGAQKYAQQAAFLAPNDIDIRILLGQVYLTLGLRLNAKRELDAAAKLDPENEMVKNLLADLKG